MGIGRSTPRISSNVGDCLAFTARKPEPSATRPAYASRRAVAATEEVAHEATEEGAQQSQQERSNQTEMVPAGHHQARDRSGEQSDDDPIEDVHGSPPVLSIVLPDRRVTVTTARSKGKAG